MLDCDGFIEELVPIWLDSGVNVMFPLEIRGGTDPFRLRKRYGRDVLLCGGVDKTALARGRTGIDEELDRLLPLVEEGAFVPHVDHRLPPDVSLADYLYYLQRKREVFGMLQD